MEIFKRKFKVKVSYFGEGKYTVKYSQHRIIPKWKELCFWYSTTPTGMYGWSTDLFYIDEAEEIAKSLKSIEDVKAFHAKDYPKRDAFFKKYNEFWSNKVPYKSKVF